ncbi:hypothetical protein XcuCFBP2542_11300 [Xanthomonas cucurbitae]|uniref:Uncharacterized protein n=1 Tax=Xanthomonas cucurbitae TaxID=56453 RepID=A0A2S7DQI2_9XANT|nr:hypothetical protein XcuCFBP2542_11300 [Xanthomonas cucurbitae]
MPVSARHQAGAATGSLAPCTPTISTGPCPLTVAGPYAAWMPHKSLHGRTCGVSRDGGRARALQPRLRSMLKHVMHNSTNKRQTRFSA